MCWTWVREQASRPFDWAQCLDEICLGVDCHGVVCLEQASRRLCSSKATPIGHSLVTVEFKSHERSCAGLPGQVWEIKKVT